MIFGRRRVRDQPSSWLASYPPFAQRTFLWFDGLSDRQRLQYAVRWPPGAAPRRVAHQYELVDRDVIELHAG